jgi:hypothetical protein
MTKTKESPNYLYEIYPDEVETETDTDSETNFRRNDEIEFDDESK